MTDTKTMSWDGSAKLLSLVREPDASDGDSYLWWAQHAGPRVRLSHPDCGETHENCQLEVQEAGYWRLIATGFAHVLSFFSHPIWRAAAGLEPIPDDAVDRRRACCHTAIDAGGVSKERRRGDCGRPVIGLPCANGGGGLFSRALFEGEPVGET